MHITTKPFLLLTLATMVLVSCQRKETFDDRVARDIANFNSDEAPKRMDSCMVLDSMCFDRNSHTLSHHYTLDGEVDWECLTDVVWQQMREELLDKLRGDIKLRAYKGRSFVFEYLYHSRKSGKLVRKLRFGAEDYI